MAQQMAAKDAEHARQMAKLEQAVHELLEQDRLGLHEKQRDVDKVAQMMGLGDEAVKQQAGATIEAANIVIPEITEPDDSDDAHEQSSGPDGDRVLSYDGSQSNIPERATLLQRRLQFLAGIPPFTSMSEQELETWLRKSTMMSQLLF
jgi:hypothetical protein